jgi:transposase-like protein
LSATTIARLKDVWVDEHKQWSERDLSAKSYVYVWADGVYLQARLEDEAQCILVIIGATPEGKKELLGFVDGARESAHDWRALLLDLKRRGLSMAPKVAVADGALGFWKAIGELWPKTREQRCWVHKTANILNKLPRASSPRPSSCCNTSGWPELARTPRRRSTPSARPMPSNARRPSNA